MNGDCLDILQQLSKKSQPTLFTHFAYYNLGLIMAKLGKMSTLTVLKQVDMGVYLGGDEQDILLPKRYVPKDCATGDQLAVFIYLDSEDRLIATTDTPKAMVGECAFLKVVDVNKVGAFLDWGLPKDLLVPYNEQHEAMNVGQYYVVYLYIDSASKRIVASTKLDKFLANTSAHYKEQQAVDLLVYARTPLGYNVVIDGATIGLLFHSDVIYSISIGKRIKGYIKHIRQDKKIDVCLKLTDRQALDELSTQILYFLKSRGGRSSLTDKSSPAMIADQFGVSKSSYKKALGKLYKKRLIVIKKTHILLANKG